MKFIHVILLSSLRGISLNRDANPLVSVIVPVYNGENYLDKLVRNILSIENSGIPIEVIFINDGSGDGSTDLINQMASSDDRIVALHQPNRGICAARNTGLDAATGSFIMFSDQDDEPVPGGIRALVDAELETEADLVIGGKDMLRTSGGKDSVTSHIEYLYEDEMLSDILKIQTLIFNEDGMHRVSHLWNCLYKRELVEAHGLRFDEAYRMGFEDTDFNNRYLLHCASVAFKSDLVYRYYRDNSSSTSLRHNPSYLDDITRLLVHLLDENMMVLDLDSGKAAFNLYALKNYSAAYHHLSIRCKNRVDRKLCAIAVQEAYLSVAFPHIRAHGLTFSLRGMLYEVVDALLSPPFRLPSAFTALDTVKTLISGGR